VVGPPVGESSGTWYVDNVYFKLTAENELEGTFLTDVYDLSINARRMAYAVADIVVSGSGSTWDSKVPTPITWDQIGADTKTWNEIFELTEGPTMNMKLKYGASNPPTSEVEKLEILGAIITGRYFQLEVNIIDPSAEVYALLEKVQLKFLEVAA
jgi:hypothetical protein